MGQSTEELTEQIEGTRGNLAADLDALQDRVSPSAIVERRKAAARDRMSGMKDKVMGTAQSARDSASGSASGAVDSVKGSAHDAVSKTGETVEGSPLAAGLVAFGAGMVISALIPASEKEAQLASKAVHTAKEQAQPLIEDAKSAGQDLGADLKDSAAQAAEEVKSSAADSAAAVKDEGASAADSVRSDVQG